MKNLREVGPELDSAALEKLQALCGHKPPADYAKFLKKTNGGKFEVFSTWLCQVEILWRWMRWLVWAKARFTMHSLGLKT